jgi:hypothetical protein
MVLRYEHPLSEIAPPFFYVLWKKIEPNPKCEP